MSVTQGVQNVTPDGWSPLPPHDSQAEESVLGAALIDPDAIVLIAGSLKPEDFYHPRNGQIYAAMLRIAARGQPTDFVVVCDELARTDALATVGGMDYLSRVLTIVPTSIHIEHYAGLVQRTAIMRRLIQAAGRIAAIGYEDQLEIDAALSAALAEVSVISMGAPGGTFLHIKPVLLEYLDQVGNVNPGAPGAAVPTGYLDLDRLLGGLQRGDLVVIAARPSVGKTSLGLGLARNAAVRHNRTVAIFSLEMSRMQIAQRLLSMETDIDGSRLREGRLSPNDVRVLGAAVKVLSVAPIYMDDTATITVNEIRARTRRLHAEIPVDLVVVDYLQFISGEGRRDNRVNEVELISRGLKALAREINAPVVVLSQLNRAVEQRAGHQPQLSDLRDGGSIEQDADVVMFLHREELYDRDSDKKGIAEVHIAKHRNGPTGICSLLFMERSAKFVDLAGPSIIT